MRHIKTRTLAFALAVIVGSGAAVADSDLWLHVKVDEAEGAKVMVNLPIGLVEKAMMMIPQDAWNDGHIMIDGHHDWTVADLRELWQEISSVGDMTFVTVQDEGENVRVWVDHIRDFNVILLQPTVNVAPTATIQAGNGDTKPMIGAEDVSGCFGTGN